MKLDNKTKFNPSVLIPFWWIGAVLVNIKSIFSDYDVDLSYAVATSYRHLSGDTLFGTMWEPHQTSAFLMDLLMLVFRKLTGGYEGVVIYLNICGVLLYALTCLFLVNTLRKYTDKITSHLIGCIFFAFRVRQIVMPEFTNMFVCSITLLILFLIKHIESKKGSAYILAAGASLCIAVLSYPSAVIICIPVFMILAKYSDKKKKDCFIFSGLCLLTGVLYIAFFSYRLGGINTFLSHLSKMFLGDSYHMTLHSEDFMSYFQEIIEGILWIVFSAFIAYITDLLFRLFLTKKNNDIFPCTFGAVLILTDLVINIRFNNIVGLGGRYVYGTIFIVLIVLGLTGLKHCSEMEKTVWKITAGITVFSCISVYLLTNMGPITAVQYLVPLGAVSLIPARYASGHKINRPVPGKYPLFLFIFSLMILLHRGILIRDYSGTASSIFGLEGIVKEGPAKGVVCSYMAAYMTKCNDEDWDIYVSPDDKLLLVSSTLNDSLLYMLNEPAISHYSTIDTATYDKTLLEYWKLYPDKKPTVIAFECWYSEMHIPEDSWLLQLADEQYELAGDGRYWRFYRIIE